MQTGKSRKKIALSDNAQHALEISELRYRRLFETAQDGILLIDFKSGMILDVNKFLIDLLGYSKKTFLKKHLWEVGIFKDIAASKENFVTLQTKRFVRFEDLPLETYDKRKINVEFVANAYNVGEGQVIQCNIRDITDRKNAERKLKEIDSAKTEFASLVAHQLRAPLTNISWYTQMLLAGDGGKLSVQQKKFVDEIYQGNTRIMDLITDLLHISRLELGRFVSEPELTDIQRLVQSEVNDAQIQIATKKLHFTFTSKKNLPLMLTDPRLMHIVIQNVISNAIRYTPEEGKITLSIAMEDKKNMLIKIADTGYGIPKAQQEQIFTKLFRADNTRNLVISGTGLGLYLTKGIVTHSGGKIWFESEENIGTTFFILLPLANIVKKE